MVTLYTDKTGRKFEIHTNIFGSLVKQVEIFETPEQPEQSAQPAQLETPEQPKPQAKKSNKRGKK